MGTKNENREPVIGGNYKKRENQQTQQQVQQPANFTFNPNIVGGVTGSPFNMNFSHKFEDPSKLGPDLKFDMNNLQGMNPQGFGQNQANTQQADSAQPNTQANTQQQTANTQQTSDTQPNTQTTQARPEYAPLTGKAMDVNRFVQEANKMSQNSWFNSNAGTRWQNYINQQLSPSVQQELYQMIQQRLEQQASRGYTFTKHDMRYIEQALKNRHYGDGKVPENFDISGRMFDSTMSKVFNNMAASFYQQQKPATQAPTAKPVTQPAANPPVPPVNKRPEGYSKDSIKTGKGYITKKALEENKKYLDTIVDKNHPTELQFRYMNNAVFKSFHDPISYEQMFTIVDNLIARKKITPEYGTLIKQKLSKYRRSIKAYYNDYSKAAPGSDEYNKYRKANSPWHDKVIYPIFAEAYKDAEKAGFAPPELTREQKEEQEDLAKIRNLRITNMLQAH